MIYAEFLGLFFAIMGAAWLLSEGAEEMAERFGVNFAGSLILGLITTLPEYMFVIFACLKGEYAVAIGSAVGACTLLVTLGYGSVILLATSRFSRKPVDHITLSAGTRIDAVYLLATSLVALGLAWEGRGYDFKDSIILIGMFLMYMVHLSHHAISHSAANAGQFGHPGRLWRSLGLLAAGGVTVFFLSEPFVDRMIEISHLIGISPVVVALIIGPLASEMPEKLAAYVTVRRDGALAEISVCNFIGSKINHNSLLLGTVGLIAWGKGAVNHPGFLSWPFVAMSGFTVVAAFGLMNRRLDRWEGWALIGFYLLSLLISSWFPGPI